VHVTFASDVEILEAKYRNMFMVSVELPSSRRKRDTSGTALAYGYEISLSNELTVHLYFKKNKRDGDLY
jgi:hypothetical protein